MLHTYLKVRQQIISDQDWDPDPKFNNGLDMPIIPDLAGSGCTTLNIGMHGECNPILAIVRNQ